jgi:hypothetical protein
MLCSDLPGTGQGWRASPFDFDTLAQLVGNKVMARAPCPLCSPMRKPSNRKLPVLTIWRRAPYFVTYSCNHCLESGWAADAYAQPVSRAEIKRRMREAEEAHLAEEGRRMSKARWLWDQTQPAAGTIAEAYLRSRGITTVPPVLQFLPARGEYPPAMVAPYGLGMEREPGRYEIGRAAVHAVHLIRLLPDGSGKVPEIEGRSPKTTHGVPGEYPIALFPPNDAGALAVAEGIENALSLHQALGVGAWAAGSANRLPKLAPLIARLPYIETVWVAQDADPTGRRYTGELAAELARRRPDIEIIPFEIGEAARDAA